MGYLNPFLLFKNIPSDISSAYQSFQVLRLITSILAGVILVKIGFSETEVSTFEWFIFVTHAFSFFWSMGLKNALSSYTAELSPLKRNEIKFGVFLLFCLIGILISTIFITGVIDVSGYEKLLALFFFFTIPGSLAEHFLILDKKPNTLFYYGVLVAIIYIACIAVGGILEGSLHAVFLGLTIWAAIRFAFTIGLLIREGTLRVDAEVMKAFTRFSVPLIMTILLGMSMEIVDGILVKHFFNDEAFAIFRFGARELPINTLLIGSMVTATIPALTSNFNTTLPEVKEKVNRYMDWMYPITLLLLIASPYLYGFFYNSNYIESAEIFNIYLLIIATRILVPHSILYAKKKNHVLMWTSFVELVVNFSLSILLMQYFGIVGIALATFITYCLEKTIYVLYLKHAEGIEMNSYINVKKYIIYNVALATVFLISLGLK